MWHIRVSVDTEYVDIRSVALVSFETGSLTELRAALFGQQAPRGLPAST